MIGQNIHHITEILVGKNQKLKIGTGYSRSIQICFTEHGHPVRITLDLFSNEEIKLTDQEPEIIY